MAKTTIRNKIRKELIDALGTNFKKYSEKYCFYFENYNDNLVGGPMKKEHIGMFDNGSGGELKDVTTPAKAKAVDSSSMLSYNFFRNVSVNTPLTINKITYDKVFFEVHLKTLPKSRYPANMDVVLLSKDGKEALFIESKFLEYLESDKDKLSDTYKKIESYFENEDNEDLNVMANDFKKIEGRYNDGIKQVICHLFGISNLLHSEKAKKTFKKEYYNKEQLKILQATNYRFMIVIFKPSNIEAKKIVDRYMDDLKIFKSSLRENIIRYINEPFIMTYKQLYDIYESLPKIIKDGLKKRYIDHHAEK